MFTIVISYDLPDAVPFGDTYTSKPYPTREEADAYVRRVIERAELGGIQLHDLAMFHGEPRATFVDYANHRVKDPAIWRLRGRRTWADFV